MLAASPPRTGAAVRSAPLSAAPGAMNSADASSSARTMNERIEALDFGFVGPLLEHPPYNVGGNDAGPGRAVELACPDV